MPPSLLLLIPWTNPITLVMLINIALWMPTLSRAIHASRHNPLFVQQLHILHVLFLWLHPTDLDKQGL
jgi:hypothetical protein